MDQASIHSDYISSNICGQWGIESFLSRQWVQKPCLISLSPNVLKSLWKSMRGNGRVNFEQSSKGSISLGKSGLIWVMGVARYETSWGRGGGGRGGGWIV